MLVLGIETSCDETSIAIVENGKNIIGVKTYSQIKDHKKFGGVVPEIASRIHVKVIHNLLLELLNETKLSLKDDIDLIAATNRPGLIGALLIGVSFANGLAFSLNKKIVGINHIEAHIYSAFMTNEKKPEFPIVALVVSGGHTFLIEILKIGKYKILGRTLDDAVGEAFDKIAKILELPYPGGPVVDKLSKIGNPKAYNFPRALIKDVKKFDFSFSGLKTSVLYEVKKIKQQNNLEKLDDRTVQNIAASAQRAIVDILINKTELAIQKIKPKSIMVSGGVAANSELKSSVIELASRYNTKPFIPHISLCTDNAAMIAGLGFYKKQFAKDYISEVFTGCDLD